MTTTLPATAPGEYDRAASRQQVLVCFIALIAAVATWFVAVRSPLWVDETWSYWQMSGGLHQIWARNLLTATDAPTYIYLLWGWAKLFAPKEVALRIPSALAMVGALVFFYRTARLTMLQQSATMATLLLAAHPVVSFAAIDARGYACATFAECATLYLLFRFRTGSLWGAALIGCAAAIMLGLHFLFAPILLGALACMVLLHVGTPQSLARKLMVASLPCLLAAPVLVPRLLLLLHGGGADVWAGKPTLLQLSFAFVPFGTTCAFVLVAVTSLLTGHRLRDGRFRNLPDTRKWLTASLVLALPPIVGLFTVSVLTPIHMFVPRYYLVALPGCALATALLIEKVFDPSRRTLFCFALASLLGVQACLPTAKQHGHTWKYALAVADTNATVDHAPIVICSPYSQGDAARMPVASPEASWLYSPLSYYPVHSAVIPMPETLNSEGIKMGRSILDDAGAHHQRFLAMGSIEFSSSILKWLAKNASPNFDVHVVGDFDSVGVLEFDPRQPITKAVADGRHERN